MVYKAIARNVKTHSPTKTFLKIGYTTRMSRLWEQKIQSSVLIIISKGGRNFPLVPNGDFFSGKMLSEEWSLTAVY